MNLTWIEISKKALLNNIKEIKKNLSKKAKFMAVVKANAYGHGIMEVVEQIKEGVDYFAVYDFEDALLLRCEKITKPILVLGRTFPSQIDLAIKHNIDITVSTFDLLEEAKKISDKKKLKIHLCVETGFGRDGFIFEDLPKLLKLIKNDKISVEGLYGHFASADESKFISHTKKQITELLKWKKEIFAAGYNPLIYHSASAGSFLSEFREEFDIVRVGLSLYGLWPSEELKEKYQNQIKLEPVLTWKTLVTEVKKLPKGSKISYGCTYELERDSKIAILPVGYYDGISRVSSNKSQFLVNGKKVPQIGRVTMNIVVLDVTDVKNVKAGDEVIVIGSNKKQEVRADDWAIWSQTSNYEIVTRIIANISRTIV